MSTFMRSATAMLLGLALVMLGLAGTASAQYEPGVPLGVSADIAADGSATGTVSGGNCPCTVSAGGATTTTDAAGNFSFPAGTFADNLISTTISVTDADGATASGTASRPFADPLPGPGAISNMPDQLSGTQNNNELNLTDRSRAFEPVLVAAPAGSGGGGGQLAFTGAQSNALVAGGMSLLLVGGAAMVVARKRN